MSYCILRGTIAALALVCTVVAADVGKYVEQLASTDRDQRREAGYQLSLLGSGAKAALPALIQALDDQDRQVWAYAVTTLGKFGPDAKDAIPKLIEGMDSRTSRGVRPRDKSQTLYRSAYTLAQIGEAAKPALLTALKGDDTSLRTGAAKAIGFMGARAPEAVPALIENLGHSDADLRNEVSDALAQIGKVAIPSTLAALASPDWKVRAGSARAFAAMGALAASAADPLLEKAASDPEMRVRAEALVALPKIGVPVEKVSGPLLAAVKANEPEMQRAALDALLLMRSTDAAVPPLVAMLKDDSLAPRAAHLLGRLGRSARSAVPDLMARAAKSPAMDNPYVEAVIAIGAGAVPSVLAEAAKVPPAELKSGHWTLQILSAIGGAALPELQKALGAKSASARIAALRTLGQLGIDGRDAYDEVVKLAIDGEPSVRAAALPALVAIGGKPPQVLEPIEAGIADKQSDVRLASAQAAGALGAKARPLVGKLAALLYDPTASVQIAAIQALGEVGGGGEWTTQLVKRLDDPKLQLSAIEALAKLRVEGVSEKLAALYPKAEKPSRLAILAAVGGAGESAQPVLLAAAQDPDPLVRAAGLHAAVKNQNNPAEVVQLLLPALSDSAAEIRLAGAECVSELAAKQGDKFEALIEPLAKMAANEAEKSQALEALRLVRTRNLDLLTQSLDNPVAEVRVWAIERLGRMGAQARPLRAKLQPMLADENEYVRRASRRAMEQINK